MSRVHCCMRALVRQKFLDLDFWAIHSQLFLSKPWLTTRVVVRTSCSLLRGAQFLSQSPASPQGANTAQNPVSSRYGLNFPMKLCFLTSAQTVLSQTPGRLFVKIYHSWGHCLWQFLHICAGDVRGWRWGPGGVDGVIIIEGQCKQCLAAWLEIKISNVSPDPELAVGVGQCTVRGLARPGSLALTWLFVEWGGG